MIPIVLDASVALRWSLDPRPSALALRARALIIGGEEVIVPALWTLDMINGIAVAERRRILDATAATRALRELAEMSARLRHVETSSFSPTEIGDAARRRQLTSYDAVYILLARRERAALATLDSGLRRAAIADGVTLLEA